ncbi:MAG: hypothetical protein D6767_09020 [Candidatus Hydrogenedentota bacterium]|nr:MAG: hypothetical protein D6767_09020 [Candidatus Hydrogenedentota bacterium]
MIRQLAILLSFSYSISFLFAQTNQKIQLKRPTSTNNTQQSNQKIQLKRPNSTTNTQNVKDPAEDNLFTKKKKKRRRKKLKQKDVWTGVGLSLVVAGAGHFYAGKISRGVIYFLGTYGTLAVGISAMLSAHQTRDVIVDGKFVREIDDTNEPLYLVGALFFVSSVLFYVGNVLDTFLSVKEYNRRVERINRYAFKPKKQIYLAMQKNTVFVGATHRF